MSNNIKVAILAAGFGNRAKKYFEETGQQEIPKGLIGDKKGVPILKKLLDKISVLGQIGTDLKVSLISNHKFFDQYQQWIAKNYPDQITIHDNQATTNEERRGALVDLADLFEKEQWWGEKIIVLPSDIHLESFDFIDFKNFCEKHSNGMVMVVREFEISEIAGQKGCAQIGNNNRIISFEEKPEKPKSKYGAVPIYYYSPVAQNALREYIKDKPLKDVDAPGNITKHFLSQGIPVYAYVITVDTQDVGTPDSIKKYLELE